MDLQMQTKAAIALAPRPGDRVLDMCAAPGGKSLVLAGQVMATCPVAGQMHAFACTYAIDQYIGTFFQVPRRDKRGETAVCRLQRRAD